ncbi:MAG: sugar phosphate isomerase/epimerase [Deltaproteobacteria bacterium]|nr:sugar phosphate isomerase/epimerase [Deltaproteobacteria bacterium]
MMKLSMSTNAYVRFSAAEAVRRIAAAGYQGVEILADAPHLYPYSLSHSELVSVERVLTSTGLEVANLNANTAVGFYGREFWEPLFEPSLANPDPVMRQWRVDYTRQCLDMAASLGCEHVSITSGRAVPGTPPERGLQFLCESLEKLLPHAERKGIRLGIEYEPGLLVENLWELRAVLDQFQSPFLGANLDLGHSHVLGEEPEEVLSTLSEKIFHVHLEDIRGRKHYHLIPGTGDMDLLDLIRMLRRRGFEGFLTLELYTYPHRADDAAREGLAYMLSILESSSDEANEKKPLMAP